MSTLYHYTSANGILGILSNGVIWSSGGNTQDAAFGKGVYLTALPPTTQDWVLVVNNWDSAPQFYLNKVGNLEYCIEFRKSDLPYARKTDSSRDIWLVPHHIDLRRLPFRVWNRR